MQIALPTCLQKGVNISVRDWEPFIQLADMKVPCYSVFSSEKAFLCSFTSTANKTAHFC